MMRNLHGHAFCTWTRGQLAIERRHFVFSDAPPCPACAAPMSIDADDPTLFVCVSEECETAGFPLSRADVLRLIDEENTRRGNAGILTDLECLDCRALLVECAGLLHCVTPDCDAEPMTRTAWDNEHTRVLEQQAERRMT